MNMRTLIFLPLLFLAVAHAQVPPGGCASGLNIPGCLPPDDPRLEGGSSSTLRPIWVSKWGAIASDGHGTFGIVAELKNEEKAVKAAIAECNKRGGRGCVLEFSYSNQCAAVGANDKNSFSFSAVTQEEAEELAVGKCEENTGETCRVYYSGCSNAVRVQ